MSTDNNLGFVGEQLPSDLKAIATAVLTAAHRRQGDSVALLTLLRMLEILHREVRDGLFQESLPDNRQALYALLRDIESEGGWPYIHRMRLRSLLEKLAESEEQISDVPSETMAVSQDNSPGEA